MQLSAPGPSAHRPFDRWGVAFFALGLCAIFIALPRAHPGFTVSELTRNTAVVIAYIAVAAGAAMRMLGYR